MIIKDRSLVFLPADIKSWMAMTFRGLEFCHRNFILHRVIYQSNSSPQVSNLLIIIIIIIGFETQQFASRFRWSTQNCRFRSSKRLCRSRMSNDKPSHYSVKSIYQLIIILFCSIFIIIIIIDGTDPQNSYSHAVITVLP